MEREDEIQVQGALVEQETAPNDRPFSTRLEAESRWSDGEALSLHEI